MSDLISRQAAIEVLDAGAELLRRVLDNTYVVGTEREKYKWGLELLESGISDMKDLPSAQPERKKGKWKAKEKREKQEIFICSECGGWAYSPWIGSRKSPKPNRCKYAFCPNCGADMRGEQDE